MSFSSDVKKELAGLLPEKTCCRAAEAYGLLQMGHAFTGGSISLQTENDAGGRPLHPAGTGDMRDSAADRCGASRNGKAEGLLYSDGGGGGAAPPGAGAVRPHGRGR